MRKMVWVEAARTVAMFIVVGWHSLHVLAKTQEPMSAWVCALAAIGSTAVPLFFFMSGFLAQRSSSLVQSSWGDYLAGKARVILIPFFLWNAIYAVFFHFLWGWPLWSGKTLWMLTTGYIHLWFLFVLAQLVLVHKALACKLSEAGARRVFWAALAVAVAWYAFSTGLLWTQGDDKHFFEWHWGKLFLGWAVFYFWGVLLGESRTLLETLDGRFVSLTVGTVLAFLLCFYRLHTEIETYGNLVRHYFLVGAFPFQLLGATWAIVALRRAGRRSPVWLDFLARQGRDTFGVYVMHLVPLFLFWQAWVSLKLPMTPLAPLVLAVATWLVCAVCIRLSRTNALRWLGRLLFGGR